MGTVVSPTQLPGTYGPRLTDNRTTTSQLGAPIVEVFGTDAVAGTVIWLGNIVEHTTTTDVGGKGGPEGSNTTFSYTQPIAIGLARGPMGGILRIWENGKLVYDVRQQQDGESDFGYYQRGLASTQYALSFTLYLGDEDQLPDPTIEAKEGVGNVTAYRGLMCIVYHDRELRDDQARRHPNFKFEVFDEGSLICNPVRLYAQERLYDWLNVGDPSNPLNVNSYVISFVESTHSTGTVDTGPHYSFNAVTAAISAYKSGSSYTNLMGSFATSGSDNSTFGGAVATNNSHKVHLAINQYAPTNPHYPTTCGTTPLGFSYVGKFLDNGQADVIYRSDPQTVGADRPDFDGYYGGCVNEPNPLGSDFYYTEDAYVDVTRSPSPPAGYIRDDLNVYRVLRTFVGSTTDTIYPVGPMRLQGDIFDTQEYWEAAYDVAVGLSLMPPGLVYGVDYPQVQAYGFYLDTEICEASTQGKSIADIVESICNSCSLVDIDVEDLRERYVKGYQIARVMDGRSAIAPLRQVGFFDACESGGIVKFPTRGKASVRTLELEDLGAHAYDSEAPPAVTTRKQQDVELPRQLFVQYRDPDRDYETGEQASPTRLITDAVNDSYVDVAVAIDATQAARCAEVIWADMWAQRWLHAIAVDCSQAELEPTDCIIVPVDGRLERMRIVSGDDSAIILRQFSLVRDDDGSYVSVAISDPPSIPPSTIVIYSPTTLLLLDLPALRVADNDAGIYAAARRSTVGLAWSGAQIYRSTDSGSTFPAIASVVNEATTGTLDVAFAAGDTTVWDDITEIFVTLISGTLESRTDDDVLAGANSMAVGAHGRWEILQFGIAEQIDADQWKLTHLLRGRRGTEHNMATQMAGDTWVLISGAGIIRLSLTNSQIGADIIYKAVTFGASFATGTDVTFASAGESLVPFSPVSIDGERDSSGDLVITWIRRDRLGSELPDGSDIAMSDPPESYEIDIVTDDSSATVVRTLTSSTQSVVYTTVQEAEDFGSSVPDSIIVRVYQMSAVVGRGTAGEATLEVLS